MQRRRTNRSGKKRGPFVYIEKKKKKKLLLLELEKLIFNEFCIYIYIYKSILNLSKGPMYVECREYKSWSRFLLGCCYFPHGIKQQKLDGKENKK